MSKKEKERKQPTNASKGYLTHDNKKKKKNYIWVGGTDARQV